MALPQLSSAGSATSKAIGNRASKLGSKIKESVDPKRLASTGFDLVKTKIASESPELSTIGSSITSFFSDVVGDIKQNLSSNNDERTNENLEEIKSETKEQTGFFDSLIGWMKSIDSNLHGSPPYLLTIRDVLENMYNELQTLTEITANAWDVSQEQRDLTRQMLKFDKEQIKKENFAEQTKSSFVAPLGGGMQQVPTGKDKKSGGGLFKFLGIGFLLEHLKTIAGALTTGVAAMLSFVGARKVAPGLIKKMQNFAAPKPDAKKSFQKTAQPKTAKKGGMFSKIGKGAVSVGKGALQIGKGALRATGIGALYLALVESIFGSLTRGVKEIMSSGNILRTLEEMLRGAIFTPIQSLVDMIGFFTGQELPNVEKLVDRFFSALPDFLNKSIDWVSKHFEKAKTMFMEDVKNAIDYFKDLGTSILNPIIDFFEDVKNRVSYTFEFMKKTAENTVKGMINYTIERLPLSDKIRSYLGEDTKAWLSEKNDMPSYSDYLAQGKSDNAKTAANMLSGQQNVNRMEIDKVLRDMNSSRQSAANVTNAPITNNVQTTQLISKNLHTRNPEAPSMPISYP